MKNKNNEKLPQFRLDLRLINYGLEKDIWKDFSNLFYGDPETSITSFYEGGKKGRKNGGDELPTSEDDSAENKKQQDLSTEQIEQEIDDILSKYAASKSQETSSIPEIELSLEKKVNEALNTFDEVVAAIEAGKPIARESVSETQRETLKKLTQIFPTSKPKKPKKTSANQVKEDENFDAEEKNAEEGNVAQPSLF